MFKDRAKITGKVTATVFTMDQEGLDKIQALKKKYPDGKKDSRYGIELNEIVVKHGERKRRGHWNLKTLWSAIKTTHGQIKEIRQILAYEMVINHNIVTDQGDAMIADLMAETPAKTKVDNTNGYIQVGTGWTGTTPKANETCNTGVAVEVMDATYPKLKGTFGNANDNVTQYRATFEAGEAEATDLDEAALLNHETPASADCLAYAELDPTTTVGASDTLQVDWEITVTGA